MIDSLVDRLVFELCFPTELKAAGKEIALISQEFARLYDPAHPVRNVLDTLDNVEEVRVIPAAVR